MIMANQRAMKKPAAALTVRGKAKSKAQLTGTWAGLTDQQAIDRYIAAIENVATALSDAAAGYLDLRRRGLEIPARLTGLHKWLPKIAYGQLAPEAVSSFPGDHYLLERMNGLPIDEQVALAGGKRIAIAIIDQDGQVRAEDKRLDQCTKMEIINAFDHGVARPIALQMNALKRQLSGPARRREKRVVTITADTINGEIIISGIHLAPDKLRGALKILGLRLVKQ
jgi:hypothetical protein